MRRTPADAIFAALRGIWARFRACSVSVGEREGGVAPSLAAGRGGYGGAPAHFVWAGALGTRCGGSRLGLPLGVLGDAVEDRTDGG